MEIKVLWMYPDLLNLYGDKGNMDVLAYRLEKRGIGCVIEKKSMTDFISFSNYDLIFIGGGADAEQRKLYFDLIARKKRLSDAIHKKTMLLAICGGYQLLGQYYIDASGHKVEGLGLFDFYTESGKPDQRCTGNVVVKTNLNNQEMLLVGFENHGGQTFNVETPFGSVIRGHGNTYQGGFEGFMQGNVIGLYMHGPLFSRNPIFVDYLIQRIIELKYDQKIALEPLDDSFEQGARAYIFNKYQIQDIDENKNEMNESVK